MLILKFGGTSVGTPQAIEKVIEIITENTDGQKIVVVSAFDGVTDALIKAARSAAEGLDYKDQVEAVRDRHLECVKYFLRGEAEENASRLVTGLTDEILRILESLSILKEVTKRSLDYVMSFGERLSARLIKEFLVARGQTGTEFLDSRLLIKTDDNFGKATVLTGETDKNIKNYIKDHKDLQIASGFTGSTPDGVTTTLGRGGSDYSAAIFGAAAEAREIEIWTDVDGILTADPGLVKKVFTIDELSYNEAMEMSYFGAKVLYPPTVLPALTKNIPIRIRNTFNSRSKGTVVCNNESPGQSLAAVKGISSIDNIALVRVQGAGMIGAAGFASRLFESLSRRKINIILISQASSEYSICFAVLPEDGDRTLEALNEEFGLEISSGSIEKPSLEKDLSVIAVVGAKMKSTSGISGKVFYALGRNAINVVAIAQGSSEINISFVVAKKDLPKAVSNIHEAFFLSGIRSVNLYLVGLGLIGGTLLGQIAEQKKLLAEKYKIRINIAGLANSKKMLFDEDGIDCENAKEAVNRDGVPFTMEDFIARMKNTNLPNTAFCDCTASEYIASFYETILHGAIPVVTPNKKANSGAYDYYKRLTEYSVEKGVPYLYEVNVCAALPVISTLHDLYLSGDTVRRVEAVFSGTLSFIFNNFDGTKPFSALVREAKALGYTEPDPRDDLNAFDAARKALIISRECGVKMEFNEIEIEPILPESCSKAKSVEDFFTELEKYDAEFEKKRSGAAAEGKRLRYIAVIDNISGNSGRAALKLRAEPEGSPFLSLVDADNIVVITTDRYNRLPLVIKGPGAGAEVTAGGGFADIVRIARTLV